MGGRWRAFFTRPVTCSYNETCPVLRSFPRPTYACGPSRAVFVIATTHSSRAKIDVTTTLRSQKAGLYPSPTRATNTDPSAEKRLTHSIADGWWCGRKQSTTEARRPSDRGWIEKFRAYMLRPAITWEVVFVPSEDAEPSMLQSSLTARDPAAARTRKEAMVPAPPMKMKGFLLPQRLLHVSLSAATTGGPMRPASGPDSTKMGIWVLGIPREDR